MTGAIESTEQAGIPAGMGVMVATCVSTLIVNANTSAVTILLPAICRGRQRSRSARCNGRSRGTRWSAPRSSSRRVRLGDVFGRRKIFVGGLLLFIASCVLIALSDTQTGVILGRCIQGAAGSTILASGLSLLTVASSGAERLGGIALRRGVGGRCRCRPTRGRRCSSTRPAGRGCSGSAPRSQHVDPDHVALDRGVSRPDSVALDRLVRHVLIATILAPLYPRRVEGRRLGLDVTWHPRVPARVGCIGVPSS